MTYCTDTDLLHWEPNLFRDAAFASQVLLTGSANVAGTLMTIAAGSLIDAHVEAEGVVLLGGAIAGCFPIVSIDSATTLTLSVLYDRLFHEVGTSGAPLPVAIGSASGLTFTIRSFGPQRRVISELMRQVAGIDPESRTSASAQIVNAGALRRPCALGTLQMIYSALAAASSAPAEYSVRAALYERLYRRALRSTRIEIDLNGDGRSDCRRALNVIELTRT